MNYIFWAIVVALGCFVLGWYAGVESAKEHVIKKFTDAQKILSSAEWETLTGLMNKLDRTVKGE